MKKPVAKKPPAKLNGHSPSLNGKTANGRAIVPHPEYRGHAMMLNGYKPEYCKQVAEMVLNGALISEIRRSLKVTKSVFEEWMIIYPEFAAALTITSEASLADERMKRSMYEQGLGYEIDAVKVLMTKDGDVKRIKHKKHIPADFNAAKFWLQNRDPMRWSRGGGIGEGSGATPGAPTQININMIRGMDTEQLKNSMQVIQSVLSSGGGGGKIVRIDKANAEEAEVIEPKKDKK